jgi:nitroimidazol reductase NimA-like FMN-containing flavoprotein (pyridoxamine 5'-phosphate oxidase superfamily)
MSESFVPGTRSKIKRVHHRGHYDKETVFSVVDSTPFCHLAYVVDGQPYCTPTLQWRKGERIYFHGSSASRMLRTVKNGLPVCVTVSHLDGLVVARSGFHCSVNYRSAMLFGNAHPVEDRDEAEAALADFVDGLLPGRWADMREPTDQEMKATTVCYMDIEEAAAKIREGGPIDDEEDYELPHWAGVIPIRTMIDPPLDDDRLSPGIAKPDYLAQFKVG